VNILLFVVVLIGLIIIHEFGHMLVAKACGMRVERFSVFFGRPIWSFRRGETEYGVGWLPLGGYVKITGMTREELVKVERDPETGAIIGETPEPPEVQARAYCNSTTPRKIATILAGPLANVLAAIVAFAIAFWIGIPTFDGSTNRVESIVRNSPAQEAGLRPGDRIVQINDVGLGIDGDTVAPLRRELQENVGRSVTLTVEREGSTVTLPTPPLVPAADDPNSGRLGFQFSPRRVADTQFGFAGGLRESVQFTWFVTAEQVRALGRLFVDQETREQVSSVVGIGATFDAYAEEGQAVVWRFVGLVSMILAIMNLIPLMPLDGGHIAFALFERIRGRRLNVAVYQRASIVGIALFGLLFFYALNNDFGRLFGEGFRP
jgi:regulator of sigma E protease